MRGREEEEKVFSHYSLSRTLTESKEREREGRDPFKDGCSVPLSLLSFPPPPATQHSQLSTPLLFLFLSLSLSLLKEGS